LKRRTCHEPVTRPPITARTSRRGGNPFIYILICFSTLVIVLVLISFEVFNYSTTDYALRDLLGDPGFIGLRWSTILAMAFLRHGPGRNWRASFSLPITKARKSVKNGSVRRLAGSRHMKRRPDLVGAFPMAIYKSSGCRACGGRSYDHLLRGAHLRGIHGMDHPHADHWSLVSAFKTQPNH